MARPASEQPTELELQLLKILWEKAPQPVRDIRDALARSGRDIAHTSVITTLNTMVKKRILTRKKAGKAFLFAPRLSREQVQRSVLGDVIQRVFDGSTKEIVLGIFEQGDLQPDDLKELRRLIDQRVQRSKQ